MAPSLTAMPASICNIRLHSSQRLTIFQPGPVDVHLLSDMREHSAFDPRRAAHLRKNTKRLCCSPRDSADRQVLFLTRFKSKISRTGPQAFLPVDPVAILVILTLPVVQNLGAGYLHVVLIGSSEPPMRVRCTSSTLNIRFYDPRERI